MNILYISADRGIPVRGNKGAAVHVRMMCRAFHQLGHRVTILTPRPGPEDGPELAANVVHVPLSGPAESYGDQLYEAAAHKLTHGKYDLVYERFSLWSSVGARLRQAFAIPFALELNAPLRLEAEQYRSVSDPELARLIERRQFGTADLIAAVSAEVAEYAIANGAHPDHVAVVPNGVDPQLFNPAVRGGSVHARYDLHGKFVVGFAGRIRPWHDIATLLAGFSRLHGQDDSYHLMLVGQYPDELPDQIAALGLTGAVTLTGPVDHHEMPAHLAAMDVAVSPYAPMESFYFSPLKLYEYLACGVPTVAAEIGQIADLIQPGVNGMLYPPGDAAALAAVIAQLRADDEWAKTVAWQGAVRVLENHTWRGNAQTVMARVGLPAVAAEQMAEPLLDNNLRQRLYRATAPELVAGFFKEKLPQFGPAGSQRLKEVRAIDILKYKPDRRCVIGYQLAGRDNAYGTRTYTNVIGKVFKDDRGRRLHAWQQKLTQNGFGPDSDDGIFIPESLAFIRPMRMQVQARANGHTLDELTARENTLIYMPRIGRALAKLHRSLPVMLAGDVRRPKPYGLAQELDGLAEICEHLVRLRPDRATAIAAIYDSLLRRAIDLPTTPALALLHRDFYYSQVLLWGNSVTLIDIDLLAQGDPAIDVANFSAHMYYLGLEQRQAFNAFAREAQRFQAAYAAFTPADEDFWQRVRFYELTTWFRLLRVVAARQDKAYLFDLLLPQLQAAELVEVA